MSSGRHSTSPLWTEWKFYFLIAVITISVNADNADNSYGNGGYHPQEYGDDWVQGEQCTRECREGDPPKYCYWRLAVEHYTSMNAACDYNKPWSGEMTYEKVIGSKTDGCILLDGVERSFLVSNRKYAPSFQVCKNDFLIVDVDNKTPKEMFTIHWHGIEQQMTQFFDGVPYVTQCPIIPEQSFRYMFRVNVEGTYYWHSHVDAALSAPGALIVREPKTTDPVADLYDVDAPQYILFLTDILAQDKIRDPPSSYRSKLGEVPDNFFINGHGKYRDPKTGNLTNTPYASYTVNDGQRYRFRMIAATATVCLMQVSITNHRMKIIALDGQSVQPKDVDSIIISTGERVDFVVHAKCKNAAQWIIVAGIGECAETGVYQLAIIHCKGGPDHPSNEIKSYQDSIGYQQNNGVVFSPIEIGCVNESPNAVCTTSLKYAARNKNEMNLNNAIASREPDETVVLVLDFKYYDKKNFFKMNESQYYVAPDSTILSGSINGQIFRPSLPPRIISIKEDPYYRQKTSPLIIRLKRNKLIRVINIDSSCTDIVNHPVHKHGGFFTPLLVMGNDDFPDSVRNSTWRDRGSFAVQVLNEKQRNGGFNNNAPRRDTMVIPYCGVVIYQFYTNNPGPWFMHCHFAWHHITGMSVIFEVGEPDDLPPVPPNFPRCEEFKPGPNYLDYIEYLEYNGL